jgi:hypothetical protein
MGLAGRRRVEHRFDVRHMVRRYEALYLSERVDKTASPATEPALVEVET